MSLRFREKAFVSATPILPSDPRFESQSFKIVEIQPTFDYKRPISIVQTNNVLEALKEIAKVTPDIDTKIKIRSDGRNVVFEYENYIITARILSGQYLKYKSLMNNTPTVKATVDKHKFKETLERGLLIVNTDMLLDGKKFQKTPVVLSIGNEKIQLEAETQKGTVKDDCAAECEGELRIGFNCEYLIDMISVCDSETITLEMSNAVSAVYVHDTENTTYLVLPVRLK